MGWGSWPSTTSSAGIASTELPLAERVAACVRIKADVVVDDEREGGRRAILNYGHTLAHALETETGSPDSARRSGCCRSDLRRGARSPAGPDR